MQKEITALAPSTMKIKIIAPPERNTLYGSVVQSWLHYLPFNLCGLQRLNTMNLVHQLFTVNAFKCIMMFFILYNLVIRFHRHTHKLYTHSILFFSCIDIYF